MCIRDRDYLDNQNGNVTITVEATSNDLSVDTSFTVKINSVNDPPMISKQDSAITVMEDSFIVVKSDYYTITDVDDVAPFSIIIQKGDNYTFAGDTLFPDYNYVGDLNVNIQPDDGNQSENLGPTFSSKITVLDRNDPPDVTQVAISPSIVLASDTLILSYMVSDPEGSTDTTVSIFWYKNDILVSEMDDSRKILPSLLSCDDVWYAKIVASDGLLSSDPVSSNKVTICKENTPPAWLDVPAIQLTLLEDSDSVLFSMADYIADEEQALSQLTFNSDSMDVSGLIGSSFVNGHFMSLSTKIEHYFTPVDSVIHISVWADDGYDGVDTTKLNITITSVNDPPQITKVPSPTINNDSLYVFIIDSVDYNDPDNDVCTLTINQGNYYSVSGDTIQPSLEFSGTLNVLFSISDGELSSDDTLLITVTSLGIHSPDQEMSTQLPEQFALHYNYPNPFNPTTTISYDLPEQAQVTLSIYDLLGKKIKTLVNQSQDTGNKIVMWDGTDEVGRQVSAGVYLYHIQAGHFSRTRKMLFLK